jgi:hypothetical protein
MKRKECSLIRELLPLYSENLLSEETAEYVKEHLAGCTSCTDEWNRFTRPLPDPIPAEKFALQKDNGGRLFMRLRKALTATVLILVVGGAGLAYASYTAGKHVGMSHPDYRFAQELGLFTEINQTKDMDGLGVTLEKGLFDGTRSVLFLSLSDKIGAIPRADLLDQTGHEYQFKSVRGWQGRYFMLEFEPIGLEAQQVTMSLAMEETETTNEAEFTFPVDIVRTVRHTRIVYPNQKKGLPGLDITLEKAVLGVSEALFKIYLDWPVDGSVAGIGIGRGSAYFPTSVVNVPDTPPPPGLAAPPPGGLMSGYASSCGINYRTEDPPLSRPALYDMTSRQEVEVQSGEYSTTQFPCQVKASLKFAPVKKEAESLELILPPVYLYEWMENSPKVYLGFGEGDELYPGEEIEFPGGKIILEKARLEEGRIYLEFSMDGPERPDTVLPHIELVDPQGNRQGQMRYDLKDPQLVTFSTFDEELREFYITLDSIGRLLPREKFILDLAE